MSAAASTLDAMSKGYARIADKEHSSAAVLCPLVAQTTADQTPWTQPWRRSVLPKDTAASGGVDALARRFGRFDVTHITGIWLPQVETTIVASR